MNVVDLLASLAKQDIRLWLEGENLRFSAPEGVFTGAIREQVISRKAEIIEFLRQARRLNEQPIPRADHSQRLPVSFSQQRLWLLDRINPRDVTYNMSTALRIRGALNVNVLEKVFAALVQRHESLRTRFVEVDGEPFQQIQPFNGWTLSVVDFSQFPQSEHEQRIQEVVSDAALTPYVLSEGPLFRAQLLKLSNEHHVLITGMHHIISDAWSMEILVKEIGALYFAFSAGMPSPLPPLNVQYADYAAWQRQQITATEMDKHQQYWVKTLTGAPPVLDIPTDRPRQDIPSNNGALLNLAISNSLAKEINQACSAHDVTPFMFFLGVWQVLLGRFANSEDVVVGIPVAGRSRGETQEIIGFFVNLLLMRLDLSGNPTVKGLLQRLKETVLAGFTHQDMPIDRVMEVMAFERQPGYPPLAQSMFQLLNVSEDQGGALSNAGVTLEPLEAPHVTARMDLVLGVAKNDERYQLSMEYSTDLFNESTIDDLLQVYTSLLHVFATQPEQRLDAIGLRDDERLVTYFGFDPEQHQILPLNRNQKAWYAKHSAVEGGVLPRIAAVLPLPAGVSLDAAQHCLQLTAENIPWLRAHLLPCDVRGADKAYWVIPNRSVIAIQELKWPHASSVTSASLSQRLLQSEFASDQAVMYFHSADHNGQDYLVISALQGALDKASLIRLSDAIVAQLSHQSTPSLQVFMQQDADWNAHEDLLRWHNVLLAAEPLHFAMPSFSSREEKGRAIAPVLEQVALDYRQRDAIAEFCKERGISLAAYCKMLFALLLQHYCRPDAGFVFREWLSFSAPQTVGGGVGLRPVVVPQALLAADCSVQQWLAHFAQTELKSSVSDSFFDQFLPATDTHYSFSFCDGFDKPLLQTMTAGEFHLQVQNHAQGLTLSLSFDGKRFQSLQFLQRALHINEQLVFGDIQSIAQLTFLSSGELHTLHEWANGDPATTSVTVVEQFWQQVAATPDRIALITAQDELTYQVLDERSNQLAHLLISKGVTANIRVGICLPRSADLVISILAVLKAGGAYVPMDPTYPRERLAFMVTDSGAPVIVSRSEYAEVLGACTGEVLALDALQGELDQQSTQTPAVVLTPEQQIYVIYTSGSTGQPKGAVVCHRGESNLQQWYISALQLGQQDRTLLVSAVGFDLTQKNIFAPLLVGGALVMPSMELFDEAELLELIERHQISWINCAPSALYPLVESAANNGFQALRSLRFVVLGGEPIRMSALYPWLSHGLCRARVINSYGPTECTDVVSWHCAERIDSPQQILPIGKPVNSTQLYILNDYLNPVVPGLVGEICVAGTGVGLGYINRADITAAAFVANPYGEGKLYRTGDLGRYLPNGEIEYIGRKDFQIKLRGLRIELGEIEFALKQLPGATDALALVRDEMLLAYVVTDNAISNQDARVHLRDYLPEYMIPVAVITLKSWPLTPNGKIDRKALPAAPKEGELQVMYVAPRNETETKLVQIWQELLSKESVGVLDDLFALGGNSLTATRILSRTNKLFGVQVSMRQLFGAPTIADLAVAVDRAKQLQSIPPIKNVDHTKPQPLSFAQQRLWFLDQFEPGNLAYSMPGAFLIRGKLNDKALECALRLIVERHAVLRSHVVMVDDQPCQVIGAAVDWQLTQLEMPAIATDEKTDTLKNLVREWRQQHFNLATGPLFKVELIRFSQTEYLLLVNMHHIVSDGWSNGILMRELGMLYDAFSHQRPNPLSRLSIQYVDFAQWQREWLAGGELERQLGYWREQLAGVDVLNLPTSLPRRPDTGYAGKVARFELSAELTARLERFSRQQGVTLYMTLLSAYLVLLSKYSNQTDITVGSPIANRNFEEIEPLIGFFVNTLVMRGNVEPELSFVELVQQVRTTTLDAYAHQDVPFERLVEELVHERNLLHSPLFQVMFSLQNVPMETHYELSGITLDSLVEENVLAKFDISTSLVERDGKILGEVVYRSGLFSEDAIAELIGYYQRVIVEVMNNPGLEIGQVDLLSPAHKQQVRSLSLSAMAGESHKTLLDGWDELVREHSQLLAVVDGGCSWHYAELDELSSKMALALQSLGVTQGSLVGLFLPRSANTLLSILAIWKAGAAYLPIDVDYPLERVQYMLDDSGVQHVITCDDVNDRLPQRVSVRPSTVKELLNISVSGTAALPAPSDLGYVIYTSGTTGKPKGVCIHHHSIENLRLALNDRIYHQVERPITRIAINASFSFDASVKQIIQLFNGKALLPIPETVRLDVDQFKQWLIQNCIDGFDCTPSQLQALLPVVSADEWAAMPHCILIGGEAVSVGLWHKLAELGERHNIHFVNVYGPTECTVDVTAQRITKDHVLPVLGKPLRNYGAWILGRSQELLPEGFVGELCVSGPGLSSGYLHKPELTQEKFVALSAESAVPARYYRTGDLAYRNEQGEIVYVGRVDNQVKVRGYRIELEEIESVITSHTSVQQAAVKIVSHGNIEMLCSFVVLENHASTDDANAVLRPWLGTVLPEYMVPAHIFVLNKMPLTPHGKVNRHALIVDVDQLQKGRAEIVAPRTDLEEKIAAIWEDVLGIEQVSVQDHFFEMGGHSLLATKVVSRLRSEFAVELPLRQLFENPTIEAIAQIIAQQQSNALPVPPLLAVQPREYYPLSFAQQRLWLLDQIEQGSAAYNMPAAVILEGEVDPAVLQTVVNAVVTRHQSLRTVFETIDGEGYQRVVPDMQVTIAVEDLSAANAVSQDGLRQKVIAEAGKPFDLTTGPLLRVCLFRLTEQKWLMLVTMHHIISDGWSIGVLINEVTRLYRASVRTLPAELPTLPVQYVDYAVWQQDWLKDEVLEQQLNYWKQQLQNLTPMELPTDKTRPPLQSYRGNHIHAVVPEQVAQQLNAMASANGATLFMVLMSAFNVLLSRYCRSDDIVVGTPIANRTQQEVEPLIGFFVNVLAIRTQLSATQNFAELLRQLKQTTIDAYDHQHLPFERLIDALHVKRDLSRSPVFQVMFILQNTRQDAGIEFDDFKVSSFGWEQDVAKYDLTLAVRESGGQLLLDFEYCTDLFFDSTIEALAQHFVRLLEQIVSSPALPIGRLDILTDENRNQLLQDWNRTAFAYDQHLSTAAAFEQQVARSPDQTALVVSGQLISYRDLNDKANTLLHYLQGRGLAAGQFVGVMCDRSAEMVVALLAILKGGAAYVPLDPDYPQARLQYVVSDAKPRFLLTQSAVLKRVHLEDVECVLLDEVAGDIATHSTSNAAIAVDSNAPGYVIYTSGSTGNPKGVVISQRAFINFIHGMQQSIGLSTTDRLLAVTSLSFDIAGLELFMPLLTGATVVLATTDEARDAEKLVELTRTEKITFMQATPATWHMLLQENWVPPSGFKVLCGGEPMPVTLANALVDAGVQLYNVYGPTETTVWSTVHKVTAQVSKNVPIGRPIANTSIYVLDEFFQPVPVGVPGELFIGGHGVAEGYLNRPDLTAERFIDNPFADGLSDKIYRTGDLVRYLGDGTLECLGRLDHQVKIRGFRIELGEIEAILNTYPQVQEGIVHYHQDANGIKYLVGYVVAAESIEVSDLRQHLARKLPDYMVPTSFMFLEAMPLTPNGKVDRKALPAPDAQLQAQREYVAPRTDLETQIAGIWGQVLGMEQVGIKDHFFEIGGHSLLAMKVISRIRQQFSIDIPVKSLFEVSTVEGMANYIENVVWLRGEQTTETQGDDDDLEEIEI